MIGFPWVRPKDWASDEPYHGERVDADEMRRIRDSVPAYKSGKTSPTDPIQLRIEVKNLLQKKEGLPGLDLSQYLLFADFLLLQNSQCLLGSKTTVVSQRTRICLRFL
jgi:hypothetical protein